MSDIDRLPSNLRQRIIIDDIKGCWLWTGAKDAAGYGLSNKKRAHRIVYQILRRTIPPWILACHTCDIRNCVNPEHIFMGSSEDNARDAARKGRTRRKLTDEQVEAILRDDRSASRIAPEYGVSIGAILDIRRGETYAHISGKASQKEASLSIVRMRSETITSDLMLFHNDAGSITILKTVDERPVLVDDPVLSQFFIDGKCDMMFITRL